MTHLLQAADDERWEPGNDARRFLGAPQAVDDATLLALWLHGRPASTRRAYQTDITRLMLYTQRRALATLTLADVQSFADSIGELAPTSQARILGSVRSLLAFALQIGYMRYNVAAVLHVPQAKNTIGERLLSEEEIIKIITLEETHGSARNATLLRTLYTAALRVAEAIALCWRDLQPHADSAVLTVFGKGSKTRHVKLGQATYARLLALGPAQPSEPIFLSRKRHGRTAHLSSSAAWRITQAAAVRAGVRCHTAPDGTTYSEVSPHWFRHAHASHALDRGAPLSLRVTRSIGERRFHWSRPRWAIARSRRLGSMLTPARENRVAGICRSSSLLAAWSIERVMRHFLSRAVVVGDGARML